MNRANGVADANARKIERRFASMNQRMGASFAAASRGLAGAFAGAAAARGATQLIDASTRIENSLKVAGLAGDELAETYDRLFQSAQRNAAPIESLVELFGRARLVQAELGASTSELEGFTENVAVALRVAGTDAQTASGALLQLSQALGAGTVRAEEFNSIQEGALPVLQAVASGLAEAGGSVAKLRALVIDGKVSSQAFFRAFEAGSATLREKVATSEFTVSQGFVRLQNVLIDTAGRFDTATGASARIGGVLSQLAASIESVGRSAEANSPAINRFLDWFSEVGNGFGDDLLRNTSLEFEMIGDAVDEAAAKFDRFGPSVSDADLALSEAEQSLANFADHTKGKMGEVDAAAQDLFQQVLEGKGSAELAAQAIEALGDANPDFSGLLGQIGNVIQRIYQLRDAAVAASAPWESYETAPKGGGIAEQRAEQLALRPKLPVRRVSMADYPVDTGGGGGAGGSGGGGGGRSGADRFAEAVATQERRVAALQRETQVQATLNPLVNDYGYAVERLRAQMELENTATEAGMELTPQRMKQIEDLASAYATATVQAATLEEQQQKLVDGLQQITDMSGQAGRSLASALSDGKLEGQELLDIVLQIGKALFGISGLGGNPVGAFVGGLLGFASGTPNTGGRRSEPRGIVHGQEAVIPLPSGGRVPVDIRMPSLPAQSGGQPNALTVHVVSNDEKLSAYVTDKAGSVVGHAAPMIVKTSAGAAPAATAEHQMRFGR